MEPDCAFCRIAGEVDFSQIRARREMPERGGLETTAEVLRDALMPVDPG